MGILFSSDRGDCSPSVVIKLSDLGFDCNTRNRGGKIWSIVDTGWRCASYSLIHRLGSLLSIFRFHRLRTCFKKTSLTLATDIDGLCKDFYFTVFCKKPDLDQTQSKVKQILKVCHFIPLPVLQSYEKTGWDTYLEKPKPKLKPEAIHPMTCLLCGKKVEHVETALFPEEGTKVFGATVIIDVRKDEEVEEKKPFIKSAFLKCQQCGAVVCYECMGYGVPKTQRFLCPTCGMATNGWTGLANRWLRLRNSMIDEKYLFKDLSLSSIRVDKTPRSDQRVVDIVVHLTGEHFGEVSFYNIAFSAKGKWFLASPEPILA